MREIAVIDFETEAIDPKCYPPKPVGLAVQMPDGSSGYYAFGHPSGNNCTADHARQILRDVYRDYAVLGHNMYFDLAVADKHWDLWPQREAHDTMLLRFLDDPGANRFGLKESAHELLGIEPAARDRLREWIIEHVPEAKRKKKSELGEFIARAPGDVVAPYAKEDVRLPRLLFDHLYPRIIANEMRAPYRREIELIEVAWAMTRRGVGVDTSRLERDVIEWGRRLEELSDSIRKRIGCGESVNLDSGDELAKALDSAGIVTNWVLTRTGKRSVSADAMKISLAGSDLLPMLEARGILKTCIGTFGRPWLELAAADGRIHTQWNSTRRDGSGKQAYGARTGRFSSSPNLQNIIQAGRDNCKALEASGYLIPHLRDYIVPAAGRVFNIRDYSQQELRILAHFEDGPLLEAYRQNPRMDIHALAQGMIADKLGFTPERGAVKIIGFGIIYGMGVGKAAVSMGTDVATAKKIRDAYLAIFPGIREINRDLTSRAKSKQPLRTWGGRLYYCEPPIWHEGKMITFDYKMLNTLIQGSAADCTKEALVRCYKERLNIVLQVHDELCDEAPEEEQPQRMKLLKDIMEGIEFDVPMLSDGKVGRTSWEKTEKYED